MEQQNRVRVMIALPLEDSLIDAIRGVSDRLEVTALTRMQRHVYRNGRPLWAGYQERPALEDESEDEAKATLPPILEQAEVILTNPIVPDDILARAPALKWLQLTSAGVDRLFETETVQSGRIAVTTATGMHAVPISEYVIGAMIAFAKGFPRAMQAQAERQWRPYLAQELEDMTVGIVGVGAIGGRVAEVAKVLGMRVIAMRRTAGRRMTGAETGNDCFDELLPPNDLEYLLRESDYVVLALPLTPQSHHLIGEEQLRMMKPTAVIVNIARGGVIDQEALIRALKTGTIQGAVVDVTDPEPLPPENELWTLPNVLITPHVSGGTPRYMERAVGVFMDNLGRYVAGKDLRNVVDVERGY
jgi:phosphoglycerate dehydrogenase-like enzyme